MGKSDQKEGSRACRYWYNFRYDPRLLLEGKNPFQLDSKAPTGATRDFLKNEVRYSALIRQNPERAQELFEKAEKQSTEKYKHLKKLEALYSADEAGGQE